MSRAQRDAFENLSEFYLIPRSNSPIDLTQIFPNLKRFSLEIGFGDGESLVHLAQANSDTGYIGIEVYKPGVSKCIMALHRLQIENIRLSIADARDVIKHQLPPCSLSEIFICFPDPWPKRRHHKRRLIQREFVNLCVNRLSTDGMIFFVTDCAGYADYSCRMFKENSAQHLLNMNEIQKSARALRTQTRYERKAIKRGATIYEFVFQRVST